MTFKLTRDLLSFAMVSPGKVEASGNATTVEPGMFDVWMTSSATAGDATKTEFELLAAPHREEL